MYHEIHRHLILYKVVPECAQPRFRQIAVVEKEVFEVRIFEGEAVKLDSVSIADAASGEVHFHEVLPLAVAQAEKEYLSSVKQGWRAWDPVVPITLVARPAAARSARTLPTSKSA